MPPISQPQGSRGGLITALVIFAILFLTAAIFAIYFNVNMRAEQDKLVKLDSKYKSIIAEGSFVSESDVASAVTALKADPSLSDSGLKWVDLLLERGNRLSKKIDGTTGPALSAITNADNHIAADNEKLRKAKLTGISIQPDNLVGSLDTVVDALAAKEQQLADTVASVKTSTASNDEMMKSTMATIEANKKAVEAANAEAAKATADAAADRAAKQAQLDEMSASVKKVSDDLSAVVQAKQLELTAQITRMSTLEKEIEILKKKLARYRLDTIETTVRRPDGNITSLGAGNTVYINLGKGDQVIEGLTFEVYDKVEGVPAMGTDGLREDDMPIGKGSIEIVHVGAATSECRIVKVTPGSAIAEGDVIANLVYDPNVKFNFVVFGKFDLDQNKVATDADTDVVKRLVTQWGGKVVDTVNADTDFVVLGKEPVLPIFTADELALPENAQKLTIAQAELDAYLKVKADARELHIPVMNQNRFLYFVGFYDQAKR